MTDAGVQRVNMVDSQVRPSDVTDRRIIRAMLDVPREAFVPDRMRSLAYADGDLPLGGGRVLLAPRTLAKLLQLAEFGDDDVVQVVGCGSGYAAAVVAKFAKDVVAVEEDAALAADATRLLSTPGRIKVVAGALVSGDANGGPYDVIIIDGAVAQVPEDLLRQLKDGGRLVTIFAGGRSSQATVWKRSGGEFGESAGFDAVAPVLPGFAPTLAFAL